jgi:hypothetical protein
MGGRMTRLMVEVPGQKGILRDGRIEGDTPRVGSRVSIRFEGESRMQFLVLWKTTLMDEDSGEWVDCLSIGPLPPGPPRKIKLLTAEGEEID